MGSERLRSYPVHPVHPCFVLDPHDPIVLRHGQALRESRLGPLGRPEGRRPGQFVYTLVDTTRDHGLLLTYARYRRS